MTTFGVEVLVNIVLVLPFAGIAAKALKELPRPVSLGELPAVPNRRAGDRAQLELFKESAA